MKWLFLVTAVALAACSSSNDPQDEAIVTQEPAATAMDGGPASGTFEVTSNDGTVLTQVLADDGSQTTTDANGEVVSGKYRMEGPERYCRMDGEETDWTCYAEAVAEDGVWTATNEADANEVWTIHRVN